MKKFLLGLAFSSTILFGASVTFQGKKVDLNSSGYNIGDKVSSFNVVKNDLTEITLGNKTNKLQILAFVPSVDTGVCALETKTFNKKISKMKNVDLYIISKDSPFALGRFCKDNNIKNITTVSDYKDSNNAKRYGTTITSPVILEGFFARGIYIIKDQKVIYKEIVNEITNEPNYNKLINFINKI